MSKHILMVVTTADKMKENHPTGLWLSEFGEAYVEFEKAGFTITVASPLGGKAPVDARSLEGETSQEILNTAKHLENTLKLDTITDSAKFDAVFLPGGHGTMFDLPDNQTLHALIRELYEGDKVVAAVCHGPAGLHYQMKSRWSKEKMSLRLQMMKNVKQHWTASCRFFWKHVCVNLGQM